MWPGYMHISFIPASAALSTPQKESEKGLYLKYKVLKVRWPQFAITCLLERSRDTKDVRSTWKEQWICRLYIMWRCQTGETAEIVHAWPLVQTRSQRHNLKRHSETFTLFPFFITPFMPHACCIITSLSPYLHPVPLPMGQYKIN